MLDAIDPFFDESDKAGDTAARARCQELLQDYCNALDDWDRYTTMIRELAGLGDRCNRVFADKAAEASKRANALAREILQVPDGDRDTQLVKRVVASGVSGSRGQVTSIEIAHGRDNSAVTWSKNDADQRMADGVLRVLGRRARQRDDWLHAALHELDAP